MIYATVEALIFGGLLEFRFRFPDERPWATAALGFHCLAILFSFTRTLWIAAFLLAAIHLIWRRSRWIFALPAVVLVAFFVAPEAVRARIADSSHLDYYSNSERIQMWRVGYNMIREHPIFGVGPGLVEAEYANYLPKGETLPAYHGHLHNNGLQLAAEFGLPVLCAAAAWLVFLLLELRRARPTTVQEEFMRKSAFLGIIGFLITGMTDYTYGHALGLILFIFVALCPLLDPAE
jgi:O-antigen ligase